MGHSQTATFSKLVSTSILLLCSFAADTAHANFKEDIGFNRLVEEFGDRLPDGSGIPVAQVEFIRKETWAPEAKGELSHVSFTYGPPDPGAFSPHAFQVARYFYGRDRSLVQGLDTVFALRNRGWYASLNLTRPRDGPKLFPWRVENHSWGGTTGITTVDQEATARLDYRIATHHTSVVVGLDNNTRPMWPLPANSYNSIAVGVLSGRHNRGGTTLEPAGRTRPHIVAPFQYTSYSAPVVASAAVLLIARAEQEETMADAAYPPVVKALLMAGATKDELPNWSNSPAHPLDSVYGAGNLNIYHSYKILEARRHNPGEAPSARTAGWDWNETPPVDTGRLYPFTIPDGKRAELSAALAWNVLPAPERDDSGLENWTRYHVRLNTIALRLWTLDEDLTPRTELSISLSEIDNLQYIHIPDLPSGSYALEVSTKSPKLPYGLAWRALALPQENHLANSPEQMSPSEIGQESRRSLRRPAAR